MADHQGPRSESRGQPPANIGDSQARRVEERHVEHDARLPRSWRPIAVEDDQKDDESSYFVSPLVTPGGIALSVSEKAEALADNLEAQFQPVADSSASAVIEKVDVALRSYLMTPANEYKLTKPEEVQEAIRTQKIEKAPGPNGSS